MKKCNISLKENIPSSQDYQASTLPDMTSNRELQIRFLLFLAYKIPDLMSYPVTLRGGKRNLKIGTLRVHECGVI
jgi:hypothetical protein